MAHRQEFSGDGRTVQYIDTLFSVSSIMEKMDGIGLGP